MEYNFIIGRMRNKLLYHGLVNRNFNFPVMPGGWRLRPSFGCHRLAEGDAAPPASRRPIISIIKFAIKPFLFMVPLIII